MRPPKRTIHVISSWVRRQPPKVKAFLVVVSGMLALVLLRVIVHDHDNLFVVAEAVHSIGTSVLIYKLMKEKTRAYEEKHFAETAQNVYSQFRDKAASSRSMSVDKMEEIAQGRVWTDNDAASRGLVDVIGGFSHAVAISKQKANIPHDKKVTLVDLTKQKDRSLIKLLFHLKNSAIGIDMTLKQLQDGLASSDGVQARIDQTMLQGLDGSSVANDGLQSTYHCWLPHSPFLIALAYWVVGLVL